MDALRRTFRPEFINRLDGIMVFHPLEMDSIKVIVDLEMERVLTQLTEHDITLEMDDSSREFLAKVGYDPQFGARPLRRAIQEHVDDPLSEGLLSDRFQPGDKIRIFHEGDNKELTFEVLERRDEYDAEEDESLEAMLG